MGSPRNNVQKIDLNNEQEVSAFVSRAKQVYEKTYIRSFRKTITVDTPELPDIPQELKKTCDAFRKEKNNLTTLAKTIYHSELGSRPDKSKWWSSEKKMYLPPGIVISRSQVLHLFGNPTLKTGLTYHWFVVKTRPVLQKKPES